MRVLVVNAGSSSLKLRLLDGEDRLLASDDLPAPGWTRSDVARTIAGYGPVDAVGHRIVHGGTEFSEPVLIDASVEQSLRALTDLAPLHQPKSLAALDAVSGILPLVTAVACFDTAFHSTIAAAAATYALPAEWRRKWRLRRFGFHGLSHAYAARRTARLLGRDEGNLRVVTCHLGAGASLAAVRAGRSVDTAMGFTPLEGLVMATRSGSVDPGLLLWLQEHEGVAASELAETLEHRSGLLGLTGTADMREVLSRVDNGDKEVELGLDVYVHRLCSGIAAMAAAMDGMDALVFTGGVGEHAPEVRRRAGAGLGFIGVMLDVVRNESASTDAEIGVEHAPVRSFVVTAREDLEIAREVRQLLGP